VTERGRERERERERREREIKKKSSLAEIFATMEGQEAYVQCVI